MIIIFSLTDWSHLNLTVHTKDMQELNCATDCGLHKNLYPLLIVKKSNCNNNVMKNYLGPTAPHRK